MFDLEAQNRFAPTSVARCADFYRVKNLPVQDWANDPATPALTTELTRQLRTPNGTQTLRPLQAVALYYAAAQRGLYGPIAVGEGKTLITLLLPTFLRTLRIPCARPLLVVEASMRDNDLPAAAKAAAKDWQVSPLRVYSYEELGMDGGGVKLAEYAPDLIMFDEAQNLKNGRAGVTRKNRRAIEHLRPMVVALTGSAVDRKLADIWEVIRWCLGINAPLPLHLDAFNAWSNALDEKVSSRLRIPPGPLVELHPDAKGEEEIDRARDAFGKRLVSSPGVVSSLTARPSMRLEIEVRKREPSDAIRDAIETMREKTPEGYYETPDGWPFESALELYTHEQELECDFYYRWNPRPLKEWLTARRDWARFVCDVLKHSKKLDTPGQVAIGVRKGKIHDGGVLSAWEAIEPSFKPHTEPVWLAADSTALAIKWLHEESEGRGIVWVRHSCVGRMLEKQTGLPYFGGGASHPTAGHVKDYQRGSYIASINSCGVGKNLHWAKNSYMLGTPDTGAAWEQCIGRTHRSVQTADCVKVVIPVMTSTRARSIRQAIADSRLAERANQSPRKLVYADWRTDSLDANYL